MRRVATLVAHGAPADELFAAVTEEAGQLLQADQTTMTRYEPDGTATVVASWRRTGKAVPPVGDRQRLGGNNLTTIISQTRCPARMDSYADASGAPAAAARTAGFRSAAGAPITVQGRLWGAMTAGSVEEQPLAPDTEARLASFTELVATAVSNAENLAALTASRARIVAAADETRRRIERDQLTPWVRSRSRGARLGLAEAVHLQTLRPARTWGFRDRGEITIGQRADLNVIDLEHLRLLPPRWAADLPAGGRRLLQNATGYRATLVAGRVTWQDGEPTGELPGRVVRPGGHDEDRYRL